MLEKLAAIKDWTSATWNKVKVVGPYLIAQSEKMSVAWQEHQLRLAAVRVEEEAGKSEIRVREETRLAEVEVFKDAASAELAGRVELRNSLLAKMVEAPPEERIELERKIEHLDGSTRILGLALKSSDYQSGGGTDSGKEIEGHWIDTFNDLARKRNEDWRKELLARALAKEAEAPGTVSARALWTIGNLEQEAFDNFAALLELAVWKGGDEPFIPNSKVLAIKRATGIPHNEVGHLAHQLSDLGLLANPNTMFSVFQGDLNGPFQSGSRLVFIRPKEQISVKGIFFTPLGGAIASFFDRRTSPMGETVFDEWLENLADKVTVVPVEGKIVS